MAFLKRPSVNRQRAKIKRFKFQVEQMDDDTMYEVPLEVSKAKMKGSGPISEVGINEQVFVFLRVFHFVNPSCLRRLKLRSSRLNCLLFR